MGQATRIRLDYSDADLRERVARFLTSRHFPAFKNIRVDVEHGAVTLSGRLFSFYEKQVALTTCQRVAGVLALVDKIAVQASEEKSLFRPR
jgi:osmotically-inducible protein OsmY